MPTIAPSCVANRAQLLRLLGQADNAAGNEGAVTFSHHFFLNSTPMWPYEKITTLPDMVPRCLLCGAVVAAHLGALAQNHEHNGAVPASAAAHPPRVNQRGVAAGHNGALPASAASRFQSLVWVRPQEATESDSQSSWTRSSSSVPFAATDAIQSYGGA